ncbi:receptor expression-enhancing protein 1 isoform X2 [Melanerpes formicivorus]|uniref:receptor expression-enhancing protein 1 isoform X2 n=1 Tax=Melanerpes formicivorus TaxID=211600 RepID=UPI00358FEA0B
MVSWIISRLVVLIFGTLYPAYYSYKAVKSKDIKEYVKWMMYWIIFALFTTAETFTDIFLCWFPFYYELKIAFVAWLLSPYTKGSSLLYRKFVHPTLSSKEKEIDDCLVQAKDRSYDALVHFGKRGLNVAATAAVMAASKGQGALSERLRSFSMQDLSSIRGDSSSSSSSSVPAPVTVRASGRQSQPKASRSAAAGSGSGVDSKSQQPAVASCEGEGSVFSDDEENNALDPAPLNKRPTRKAPALEAPPRTLRPRFRKKSTSSPATDPPGVPGASSAQSHRMPPLP